MADSGASGLVSSVRGGATDGVLVTIPIALVVTLIPLMFAMAGDRDWVPVAIWAPWLSISAVIAEGIVGATWARRLKREPDAFRSGSILAMSVMAIVIGAYVFASGWAVFLVMGHWPDVRHVLWVPVGGTIGLVAFGLPALAVVVPHAIAWRRLMRRRTLG